MIRKYLLLILAVIITGLFTEALSQQGYTKHRYLAILDDAQLGLGLKTTSVFALDDRAPLSANPHFQAMWNLIQLGAKLESLLHGTEEPLSNLSLNQEFGRNGYNKTLLTFFAWYGFGESTDTKIQRHFIEFVISSGYFKQSRKGTNLQLNYRMNLLKTNYGAGGNSLQRTFDYEIYAGARAGFDWSFRKSEGDAGFFNYLNSEVERIAYENEFTASQLIALEDLVETSKILLPEDVGGRAFFIGPTVGARLSKPIMKNFRVFADLQGFYDIMDLVDGRQGEENRRSQHQINLSLGASLMIGSEGEMNVRSFY
ncbi:MAG TPA: hypothetical protein PKE06_08620 [Flavilitoribacter sp.]|nr:hypothetical protein [Flavilitoribacter sp.]HMQ89513.1 hypothetical protein [Flavilitoribacter sp.]